MSRLGSSNTTDSNDTDAKHNADNKDTPDKNTPSKRNCTKYVLGVLSLGLLNGYTQTGTYYETQCWIDNNKIDAAKTALGNQTSVLNVTTETTHNFFLAEKLCQKLGNFDHLQSKYPKVAEKVKLEGEHSQNSSYLLHGLAAFFTTGFGLGAIFGAKKAHNKGLPECLKIKIKGKQQKMLPKGSVQDSSSELPDPQTQYVPPRADIA